MIYAIQAESGGPIKIGVSRNPYARLNELQTGHPEKLRVLVSVDLPHTQERELHKYLDEYRLSGEWFKSEEPVLGVVESMKAYSVIGEDFDASMCPDCNLAIAYGIWNEHEV